MTGASRPLCAALVAIALAGAGCKRAHAKQRWGIGVATFDATALGLARARTPDPFVDAIRPGRLGIPTYDGSNQATHPDVLLERDAAGAPHLTMAMTPYPYSDEQFENPCLLVSSDGTSFAPAPGAPVPLVPPPPYDHNDDPDLPRDPRTGEYELLYLETLRPDRQTLVALRSRDKITWTRRDAIVYDLKAGAQFIVSPAAIDEGGVTHLFYVDADVTRRVIYAMTSADGVTWDPHSAAPIQLAMGAVDPTGEGPRPAGKAVGVPNPPDRLSPIKAWHVDVIRGDGAYGLLFSG
ncbi:MAG: hypothetical protein E6J91_38785 [Deltaproteobacteria bacterium]|nr:MAG: hypothetical protein E6J91_38785 [Deltaproteobacteria bacterium]